MESFRKVEVRYISETERLSPVGRDICKSMQEISSGIYILKLFADDEIMQNLIFVCLLCEFFLHVPTVMRSHPTADDESNEDDESETV